VQGVGAVSGARSLADALDFAGLDG